MKKLTTEEEKAIWSARHREDPELVTIIEAQNHGHRIPTQSTYKLDPAKIAKAQADSDWVASLLCKPID